ncbi:second domain of [Rozella allomycis CSF55]|uniref:FERM central domain-containing protein n=1 Tax=Rozella allomycis (strain CSF55) TaxID=988480 RepID=A0A075B3U2_ROZAC|nr:FERM central domain-containing protein [Rozella allomycis CSF55]RKP20064.1 second domain of [Rozella allomycis CSF55]|eukprot:EPZ35772.1 FERM central domain-containing protein [Rozella allomycis CSF55]
MIMWLALSKWKEICKIVNVKDRHPTADLLKKVICEKEMIDPKVSKLFALWMVGKDLGINISFAKLELRLRPRMNLIRVFNKWKRWCEKYAHNTTDLDFRFVFRREALIDRDIEAKSIKDETTMKLMFGEARVNIMRGRYPCSPQDAIILASYILQAVKGNFDHDSYRPGQYLDGLWNIVPQYLSRVYNPKEWENRIVLEYEKLIGLDSKQCYNLYLNYVRQWSIYGSTWLQACLTVPQDGFFERRKEHILVGVNADGIHVVDLDKKSVLMSESFDNLAWDVSADRLDLEYGPEDKPSYITLITPQALLIDDLASKAISIIESLDEIERVKTNLHGGGQRRATIVGPDAVRHEFMGSPRISYSRPSNATA